MPRIIKKTSNKKGLPPGTLVHVGDKKTQETKISIIDYNKTNFTEIEVKKIEEIIPYLKTSNITWINIDGLHEIDIFEKIGDYFNIHPLVLEDILNTDQRPKMEDYEKYVFFVLKMLNSNDKKQIIKSEQISIILGRNFVLSFQEVPGDVFDTIRARIRNNKGKIRKMGPDYLVYSLIDSIVDNYFTILEKVSDKIEILEENLVKNPTPDILQQIYNLKREMIHLRRSVWPLRELINNLLREESRLIKKTTHIYLRDLYDHTIQVIDTIETFRDMISGMLDIYMSSVSNKMNEIMKVLTIFAAIFIPLTFIAGIYGMNFNQEASPFNMPELNWAYGYFFALSLMVILVTVLLIYFKKKKWI